MAEEIDDNGFYREDFSAESDWEIFNAQMCEIFQTWELSTSDDWGREFNAGELFSCKWHVKEENLKYLDKKITVTYYKADLKTQDLNTIDKSKAPLHVDLMSRNNTFSPSMIDSLQPKRVVHTLARYYGLRRFVLLQVVDSQGANLNNQSDFGITSFLSSIFVVTAELNWSVPVFLQIFHPSWCYFVGVGMTFNMRTNFDAVSLHDAPERMRYLSGLLKIFKEKVPHSYEKPAIVSVQNIYDLDEIRLKVPMYVPFDLNPLEARVISLSQFTALPHGYFSDSKSDIYAIFTWPEIAENTAIDSELQTQFTPSKAHYGFVQLMSHATSYLSSCLTDFKKLSESKSTLQSYVGRYFSNTAAISDLEDHSPKTKLMKMRSAMQQENYYKLYKETEQQSQKKVPGPMTDHVLNQMLYYLFPDMHPEKPLFPYETPQRDPHRIKSATPDSLVQRLSCLLATCNAHFGGERGLVQIWASFIKELRFLWDNCLPIPGISLGFPDTKTCLLHQKLQMLNVCIERRLEREFKAHRQVPGYVTESELNLSDSLNDEDEFYDCLDHEERETAGDAENLWSSKSTKVEKDANKADGRLKRLGNVKLIAADEYLYIPVTQEVVPKTEDQFLDDNEDILSADQIRQKMASSLQSDMDAFKAANPLGKLEDFIRWYSPVDWVESVDENAQKVYQLSGRMSAPGNIWQKLWEQSKPIPAYKQKRLFDDTNEGFKVLTYLETRNVGEVYQLTVVPLLHSSILKLKNIFINSNALDVFEQTVNETLADLCRLSRDIEAVKINDSIVESFPNIEPILVQITKLELQFYQFKCFESIADIDPKGVRATEIKTHFKEMMENNGCYNIRKYNGKRSGQTGHSQSLIDILNSSFEDKLHQEPISKEYVIRLGNDCADMNGRIELSDMPQFLRGIVAGKTLRLCGAFTENTTFLD